MRLHTERTWRSSKELDEDPVEWGQDATVPVNHAQAKFTWSTVEDGLNSLAAKLPISEQATYTTFRIHETGTLDDSLFGGEF